jgi:hypothetical protein
VPLLRRGGLALALLAATTVAADAPGAQTEYAVKAAFLYNFAKYVQWPAETRPSPAGAFVITVLGRDPFGSALEENLQGKEVDQLRVVVRRVHGPEEVGPSQIVFISDSQRTQLPAILKQLGDSPTLTVGDMDHFAERGGVIQFRTEGDRVRLSINRAAAERAHLRISAELLKLAKLVGSREEP